MIALQPVNINEKINHAPDNAYEIGLLIGSFIPFVLFAALAYYLYYKHKKK